MEHKWVPSETDPRRHCETCGVYEDYGKNFKCEVPKPVGRPAMDPDDKRKPRSIKMTDEEWETIKRKAEGAGVSATEFIRLKTLAGD